MRVHGLTSSTWTNYLKGDWHTAVNEQGLQSHKVVGSCMEVSQGLRVCVSGVSLDSRQVWIRDVLDLYFFLHRWKRVSSFVVLIVMLSLHFQEVWGKVLFPSPDQQVRTGLVLSRWSGLSGWGLDSEDFITDLDELVEVDLGWDGGLLSLGEVELRVGQSFQS